MNFLVVAPNKISVHIANGYMTQDFKHGTVVNDERLARTFPHIFIPLNDNVQLKTNQFINNQQQVQTEIKIEPKRTIIPQQQELSTKDEEIDFNEMIIPKQTDTYKEEMIKFSQEVNSPTKKGKK